MEPNYLRIYWTRPDSSLTLRARFHDPTEDRSSAAQHLSVSDLLSDTMLDKFIPQFSLSLRDPRVISVSYTHLTLPTILRV